MHYVKVLTDAAKTDWRASAWLLSHCWPKEFSELATSRQNRRRSANAYWDFQSDGHCEQRPPQLNGTHQETWRSAGHRRLADGISDPRLRNSPAQGQTRRRS